MTESRERPAAVTSGQLTVDTEEETKSFVSPTFISVAFAVLFSVSLQLLADLRLQHGESVTGDPAAAAGREESGREGGRSPQT